MAPGTHGADLARELAFKFGLAYIVQGHPGETLKEFAMHRFLNLAGLGFVDEHYASTDKLTTDAQVPISCVC